MDRAISPNEVKVVKWLLEHALVDVAAYRLRPVEQLRVVGGCTCGCTTLDFKRCEQLRGKRVLADELAIYPDGQHAGLILWGLEGEIVMVGQARQPLPPDVTASASGPDTTTSPTVGPRM